MRNKLVPCTNVLRLNAAIENLLSAPPSMPHMNDNIPQGYHRDLPCSGSAAKTR
jgi:hypothetical protein